jgi:hypothetical protein
MQTAFMEYRGRSYRMKRQLRLRLWLEAGLATATGVLFVITLVWKDWIERAFGLELDGGNGSLEWLIVGVLFVVTVALIVLARSEWRRSRTVAGSAPG